MTPSHAVKKDTRYRYYVSRSLITKDRTEDSTGLRVPAAEIEQLVTSRVRQWLLDRGSIYKATSARFPDPSTQRRLAARAAEVGKCWPDFPVTSTRAVLAALIERIEVSVDQIKIRLRPRRLNALLDVAAIPIQGVIDDETEIVSVPVRLRRAGREIRMVIDGIRYWSVVENTRVAGGRVVQRHVLYLGEINDSQELAWRRSIEVLEDGAARPRTLSLFPEDRVEGLLADASIVGVRLSELRLRRPRQWGACWLALTLWRELQLDQFWSTRLGVSHKGTHWDRVLFVLVAYRLLAPGSEWRLHREWFQRSALADLLGEDAGLAEIHKLYRCHDRLLEHKQAVFDHLVGRWRDLFNISYDVLLYDLTSTYFEADPPFPEGDKRRFGYSRDHRPDCVQIIMPLVVTPRGLPLAYQVL